MSRPTVREEVDKLAGDQAKNAVFYITGSHLYGLETPESDVDVTIVYYDRKDDSRVFRQFPAVAHNKTNDLKLYSLRKIAESVGKGNPNATEMIYAQYRRVEENEARDAVHEFFSSISRQGTQPLAASYRGHLRQIIGELVTGSALTPKRVSHAIRVGESCLWLLRNGRVPRFASMTKEREYALAIKCGEAPVADGLGRVQELESQVTLCWAEAYAELPDNAELTEGINDYFVGIR